MVCVFFNVKFKNIRFLEIICSHMTNLIFKVKYKLKLS